MPAEDLTLPTTVSETLTPYVGALYPGAATYPGVFAFPGLGFGSDLSMSAASATAETLTVA